MLTPARSPQVHLIFFAVAFSVTACGAPPRSTPLALPTTAPPASLTPEPRAVIFTTADGVILHGMLYGSGPIAVIFSEMGAQKQETWTGAAEAVAAQGYHVLTYDFRYWVSATTIDDSLRDNASADLTAALAFVRAQGAERVVLVGASLGALATLKVATAPEVAAVVILAAPLGPVEGLNLQATPADVQAIRVPKLFIASEQDEAGFADDVQQMFDLAAELKAIQFYPGRAHGTDLLTTPNGPALIQRLITFIETSVATPAPAP
jgi:dienelactone hydrolase